MKLWKRFDELTITRKLRFVANAVLDVNGTTIDLLELAALNNLSATELGYLDTVVAGTIAASKAVVVDSNKDVGSFRNVRATRLIHAEGAPTSINTAGPATLSAAQLLSGIIVRDTNGAGRTDTTDTAAAIVAAIPNAAVGDVFDVLIVNGADAAETITLAGGTGVTFDANQTAASRVIGQNASKLVRFRLTNVTPASEAVVAYC